MNFVNRLKVSQRFVLLGVFALVLTLIPSLFFFRVSYQNIQVAQQEAAGIAPIKGVLKLVQLTQQHRGLSGLVLGGNAAAQAQLSAKKTEVDQAYQALNQLLAAGDGDPALTKAITQARETWQRLASQVAGENIDSAQSFQAHTALVEQLLGGIDQMADVYGLSLDPELDSYQMIQSVVYALPLLTEELGKTRARGAAVLTRKSGTAAERQDLALYISHARSKLAGMKLAYDKAVRATPQIGQALDTPVREAVELVGQASQLALEQVVRPDELSYPAVDYFAFFTKTIDAQVKLNGLAMDLLDQMLTARVSSLQRQLLLTLAAMLVIAVLGFVLGVSAARSIIQQLGGEPHEVMAIANAVAAGDLSAHITLRAGAQGSIMDAMARMQYALQNVVSAVRQGSESVATASAEIAQGNQRPVGPHREPGQRAGGDRRVDGRAGLHRASRTPTTRARPTSWRRAPAPWPSRAARWWPRWWTP